MDYSTKVLLQQYFGFRLRVWIKFSCSMTSLFLNPLTPTVALWVQQ